MKDEKIKDEIRSSVSRTAGRAGMEQYQEGIVNSLVEKLETKRETRIIQESVKASVDQRTKSDALRSVEVLVTEACAIAKSEKRKLVTASDFDKAYQAKFCMVWPFC